MNSLTLVENWRKLLAKSYVIWLAIIGAIGPEVLQAIADNSSFFPWFDEDWKSTIRTLCLIAIPMARVLKQNSVSGGASQ